MHNRPIDSAIVFGLVTAVAFSFIACGGAESPDAPTASSAANVCTVVASCTYDLPSTGARTCDELTSASSNALPGAPGDVCRANFAGDNPSFAPRPCLDIVSCETIHDTATGCDWRRCVVTAQPSDAAPVGQVDPVCEDAAGCE